MKKTFIIVGAVILCLSLLCASLFAVFSIVRKSDALGVQDDGVYFNMPPKELTKVKGTPAEINEYKDMLKVNYHFEEVLYGYTCETLYGFIENKLYLFETVINVSDEYEAKALFYRVYDYMTGIYSKKNNYSNAGIDDGFDSDKTISARFDTDNGATGAFVKLKLENGSLSIYVINGF